MLWKLSEKYKKEKNAEIENIVKKFTEIYTMMKSNWKENKEIKTQINRN